MFMPDGLIQIFRDLGKKKKNKASGEKEGG